MKLIIHTIKCISYYIYPLLQERILDLEVAHRINTPVELVSDKQVRGKDKATADVELDPDDGWE